MKKEKTSSTKQTSKQLSSQNILEVLQTRFESNPKRHQGIAWVKVIERLEKFPQKLKILTAMENTGGEPDVVDIDKKTGEIIFFDCSAESPSERRSFCYDPKALESRKEHKPKNSAIGAAKEMGMELLDETQYRFLQTLGSYDLKTSSWLKTPEKIRQLGGAIFGDCRFDTVFIYHNGAESYYGARGFRGFLKV